MNQSESIAKLAEALAKAQGVMDGASKDSRNPFFQSSYADLSSVWDACRKPLSDNGLSVIQTSVFIPEHPEMVCIETILCHSSGEWIKGMLAVKPIKPDPQSVGSCITYLRRYSLQSMVGIAPEDDDGNAASGKVDEKKNPTVKQATPATKVQPEPTSPEIPPYNDDVPLEPSNPAPEPHITISEKQAKRMFAISKSCGWSINELRAYLKDNYNIVESSTTPLNVYDNIIKHIQDNNRVKVA